MGKNKKKIKKLRGRVKDQKSVYIQMKGIRRSLSLSLLNSLLLVLIVCVPILRKQKSSGRLQGPQHARKYERTSTLTLLFKKLCTTIEFLCNQIVHLKKICYFILFYF